MNYYYIAGGAGLEGPFDLLSMIRKAKIGRLLRETPVSLDPHEEAKPAEEYPELLEIIDEEERALATPQAPIATQQITLTSALRNGWEAFQLNQTTAVLTGIFVIIAVLGLIVLSALLPNLLLNIVGAVWTYFVFNIYLIALLRKTRMQLLHNSYFTQLLKKCGLPILMTSAVASIVPGIIPALLTPLIGKFALLLVFVPGTLAIAYLLFVPLIMVDRNIGLMKAMAVNKQKMTEGGINTFTVIYGLLVGNFIIPILPITMPVTLSATCDIYDRIYNEY